MRSFFFLLLLLPIGHDCAFAQVTQQSRVAWLKEQVVPIRTLSPDSLYYSDLDSLKSAIGNSRIVMLGEESHGDGSTFEAKSRLIKFLHKEMGFDVIAFESSMFECRWSWMSFSGGYAQVKPGYALFPLWGSSEEVQSLLRYLEDQATSKTPLELAGFDIQPSGFYQYFDAILETYIKDNRLIPDSIESKNFEYVNFRIGMPKWEKAVGRNRIRLFEQTLDSLVCRSSRIHGKRDTLFTKFMARQIYNYQQNYYLHKNWKATDMILNPQRSNLRDSLMGENLVWLARNFYKNKKIIVWAATSHLCRNFNTLGGRPISWFMSKQTRRMGDVVYRLMGDSVYTIGFTAATGEAAAIMDRKSERIKKPKKNSYEDLMVKAGFENAFLDFRKNKTLPKGAWLRNKLWMRPLGYYYLKADWTELMDGIIFTKNMKRSHPTEEWKRRVSQPSPKVSRE